MSNKKQDRAALLNIARTAARATEATKKRVHANPFLNSFGAAADETEAGQAPEAPVPEPVLDADEESYEPPVDLDSRRPQKAQSEPAPEPEPVPQTPSRRRPGRPPKYDLDALFYSRPVPLRAGQKAMVGLHVTESEYERLRGAAALLWEFHWKKGRAVPAYVIRSFVKMWIDDGCPAPDLSSTGPGRPDCLRLQLELPKDHKTALRRHIRRHAEGFEWIDEAALLRGIILRGLESASFGKVESQLEAQLQASE